MSIVDHLLSRLSTDIEGYQNLQSGIHENCSQDLAVFQNAMGNSYINPEILTVSLRTLHQLKGAMEEFYRRHPVESSNLSLLPTVDKAIRTTATKEYVPFQTFEVYLKNYCPGIRMRDALQYVADGKELFGKILSGETEHILPEEKTSCLAKCVWYLMHYALNHQNKGFVEGTFDIADPDHKIFNFFHKTGAVYSRSSCHYPERTEEQWGIDIFPRDGTPLPSGKRTVLFGILATHDGSSRMFLKPENYGANVSVRPRELSDSIMHGVEYLLPKYKKTFQGSKVLKKKFPGVFSKYPSEVIRKEQTSKRQRDRFLKIVNRMKAKDLVKSSEIPHITKQMQMYGISYIYRSLREWSERLSSGEHAALQGEIKDFMTFFEGRYDHLEYRRGDEIQINDPFYTML